MTQSGPSPNPFFSVVLSSLGRSLSIVEIIERRDPDDAVSIAALFLVDGVPAICDATAGA
jgi:hypothetical protein